MLIDFVDPAREQLPRHAKGKDTTKYYIWGANRSDGHGQNVTSLPQTEQEQARGQLRTHTRMKLDSENM